MSHLNYSILAFSTNFGPTKIDLSGNSVWLQALGFQKLAKLSIFNELLSTQNALEMLYETFSVIFKHRGVGWDNFSRHLVLFGHFDLSQKNIILQQFNFWRVKFQIFWKLGMRHFLVILKNCEKGESIFCTPAFLGFFFFNFLYGYVYFS